MQAYYFKSLPSTNDKAMELAHQLTTPEFSYVVAEEQTNGRGRNGNSWCSSAGGGLYMSMLLRPQLPAELLPQLTLVAGVAVCDVLKSFFHSENTAEVGIKWPNDILVNGRKVAGILCEAELSGEHAAIVVGIGINISFTQEQLPVRVLYPATSLLLELGDSAVLPSPVGLAEGVAVALKEQFEQFYLSHQVFDRWSRYDILAGKRITISTPDRGIVAGIASGITPSGELKLIDEQTGSLSVITAGSIIEA